MRFKGRNRKMAPIQEAAKCLIVQSSSPFCGGFASVGRNGFAFVMKSQRDVPNL